MLAKKWSRIVSRGRIWALPFLLGGAAVRWSERKLAGFYLKSLLGVKIGRGCHIGRGLKFATPGSVSFGDGCIVGEYARFWSEMEGGKLTVADDAEIGRNAVVDYSGKVSVGHKVVISERVIIYTHDHGYDPKSKPSASPLVIEDGAWIGAQAIILPSVRRIGRNALVGAGAVVTRDVPDDHVFVGGPGKLFPKRKRAE